MMPSGFCSLIFCSASFPLFSSFFLLLSVPAILLHIFRLLLLCCCTYPSSVRYSVTEEAEPSRRSNNKSESPREEGEENKYIKKHGEISGSSEPSQLIPKRLGEHWEISQFQCSTRVGQAKHQEISQFQSSTRVCQQLEPQLQWNET